MSSRFVKGMVIMCKVGTLLAAAALLGGCAAASAQTKVLIYSDQSAGSLMMSSANRHAELAGGAAVTFTADAGRMPSLVDGDNWERILVFARWTAQEPAYVHNLRQFAFGKPQAMVYMELWHDDGRTISPQVCVRASVAVTMWTRSKTGIYYAGATDKGPGERDGSRFFDGQIWPTWEHIVPRPPEGIVLLPSEAEEHRQKFDLHEWMISRTDRAAQCLAKFETAYSKCHSRYTEDLANCEKVYAAAPSEHAKCTMQFGHHLRTCLSAERRRYEMCVMLLRQSIPSTDALPGGGVTN